MRRIVCLMCALLAASAFGGGRALANVCQAGGMTCATGMPVDGYCECHAHGMTEGGTVMAGPMPHMSRMMRHHTHDCAMHPDAPGCPH